MLYSDLEEAEINDKDNSAMLYFTRIGCLFGLFIFATYLFVSCCCLCLVAGCDGNGNGRGRNDR